jgi:hypothetical protein
MSSRKRRASSRLQQDSEVIDLEQETIEDMLAEAPRSECALASALQLVPSWCSCGKHIRRKHCCGQGANSELTYQA